MFAESENRWAGINFLPGRGEFAVIVPDGRGRPRTLGYEASLAEAVALRRTHITEISNRASRRLAQFDKSTLAKGDHE
jgi:hypothetical protein